MSAERIIFFLFLCSRQTLNIFVGKYNKREAYASDYENISIESYS